MLHFQLTEDEEDERAILEMEYKRYLNKLAVMDTRWITESIRKQESALQKLKVFILPATFDIRRLLLKSF